LTEADQAAAGGAGGTEFSSIRRWLDLVPTQGASVRLGPGDDVAVLDVAGALAVSTDAMVEGTHFRPDADPADVGWKALAVALSDLAASRSRPLGALVSLSVRAERLSGWADAVMAGLGACARAHDCPVVGGDTTVIDGPAVVGVTVLGRGDRVLTRAGAVPGDVLQISGPTGWAAAGLHGAGGERGRRAQERPRPRLDLLESLAEAHAAIDVSDGLLADAAHLAAASGVTLRLDPVDAPDLGPDVDPAQARAWALTGGEDYEVLATAEVLLPGFVPLGLVTERGPHDLVWGDGRPVPASDRGWVHGARS